MIKTTAVDGVNCFLLCPKKTNADTIITSWGEPRSSGSDDQTFVFSTTAAEWQIRWATRFALYGNFKSCKWSALPPSFNVTYCNACGYTLQYRNTYHIHFCCCILFLICWYCPNAMVIGKQIIKKYFNTFIQLPSSIAQLCALLCACC